MSFNLNNGIPESDLPVKSPSRASMLRYVENGKSYSGPLRDVIGPIDDRINVLEISQADGVPGVANYADIAALFPSPTAGQQVDVLTDSDPSKVGRWGYIGGSWVKSADRVTGLEGRVSGVEQDVDAVEEVLSRVAAIRDGTPGDIEVLEDDIGMVVRRTDAEGNLFLPGVEDGASVQGALAGLQARSSTGSAVRPKDVLAILDPDDNVLARMDYRGGFYLPGSKQPLQAAAGMTLAPATFPRTAREKLHPIIKPMVADLVAEQQPFVPPPTLLVPNNYGVPDGFISAFSVDENVGIMLETPYGTGGLVHPHLIEMRKPAWGYKFLMMDSPHKFGNAREENPILYGSNDLRSFDLIPDVPQPLGYPPANTTGYMQDPGFTYDPTTGGLTAFWTDFTEDVTSLHYRTTYDCIEWGAEMVVTGGAMNGVAPAILYDPFAGVWRMWSVRSTVLYHHTGPTMYGPWVLAGSENFQTTHGIPLWHMEIKWLGNRFFILANQRSNQYLGFSANGTNWTMGPALVNPPATNIYKGTFIPEFDGDRARIHVGWHTYAFPIPAGMIDSFHLVSSAWADLTTL